MLDSILAIVFAAGAIVVYFAAARAGKSWAVPLMVVFVIAALVSMFIPRLISLPGTRGPIADTAASVALIGERLSEDLSPGARVLILREPFINEWEDAGEGPSLEQKVRDHIREVGRGLEEGLGFEVDVVDSITPAREFEIDIAGETEVRLFNRAIGPYEEARLDLIISEVGIPGDIYSGNYELHRLDIFAGWDAAPLFADNTPRVARAYEEDMIRRYVEGGYLAAFVVSPDRERPGKLRAITKENIEEVSDLGLVRPPQ